MSSHPKTIGVLGSGQLGLMFAERARHLGYKVVAYSPDLVSPMQQNGFEVIPGSFSDQSSIESFLKEIDLLTFEFENIPPETLDFIEERAKSLNLTVSPNTNSLKIAQNRYLEKSHFQSLGFQTAQFFQITDSIEESYSPFPFPWIVKTIRFGYDGKGQTKIKNQLEWIYFLQKVKAESAYNDYIVESFVPFETEVSVIIARFENGQTFTYGTIENRHSNHILDVSIFPAEIPSNLRSMAISQAEALSHSLSYVGVLGMEFFVTKDSLVANEFAPRPHNSGHFSQDCNSLSQFDLQLFSVLNLKLNSWKSPSPTIMKNLVGEDYIRLIPIARELCTDPRYKMHLYNKAEVRTGRKMGHLNFQGSLNELDKRLLL